ncbi:CBO0543 family protein [Niallia sp. NCCP-28]|uniref:CBO0543 family protein n=1 Tax=Niallia sp. NCCP-28 TaxID=2934712 RepID=UPI002080F163|nr:CBO0543 family protein [Niallia sp. NCCP-28]GKU84849.1 hypothetical protein NCCP28_42450 [Niallia sp. NCCP-28]
MDNQQQELLDKLASLQDNITKTGMHYWQLYSHMGTWQFWVVLLILVVPLVLLYFVIDRKNILLIGFFGFANNLLSSYIDVLGIDYRLWSYPYQLLPFLPSLSLDASIVPIYIMLVYQWTIKHDKNFYLTSFVAAIIFGYGFTALTVWLGLFEMHQWMNYFYIFLSYYIQYVLTYLLVKLFLHLKNNEKMA